ncbi:MAG: type II toxin-antitoxin system RelE/ParE family toxin [Stellaceae bacterium]
MDGIWDYLLEESGSDAVADRQIDALAERFYLLSAHPYAGRARDDDLGPGRRSFPVDRYDRLPNLGRRRADSTCCPREPRSPSLDEPLTR